MTVSTLTFYKTYAAAAAQTVFPYDFLILSGADLKVYDDGTLQVLGVDYTVSGAGMLSGGNVTFVVGRTAGHTILIRRETPRTQATDLEAAQRFYEAALEAMADKLTLIAQEFPSLVIPTHPTGYYLRTKADGSGIEAVSAITGSVVMPFDVGVGPPTTGTWATGFVRFNSAATAGGYAAWICVSGGTPGTWEGFGSVNLPWVDARAYASLAAAMAAASGKTLLISTEQAIANDTAIDSTVHVKMLRGGSFAVAAGKTLTINGPFEAGLYQVFSGTGSVVFGGKSVCEIFPQWWGATGDGVTDDAAPLSAALTSARASSPVRVTMKVPIGTYLHSTELDFSDISVHGAGLVATVFKVKSASAITRAIKVSGGRASYKNFTVNGNSAGNPPATYTTIGIDFFGGPLWTNWENVRVTGTPGNGVQFRMNGGLRPNMHTFINLQLEEIQRNGIRIDAGRNLHFISLDAELTGLYSVGLAAVTITNTDEPARRIIFDNPWIEKVGVDAAGGFGFDIVGASNIVLRKGQVTDYGDSSGGGKHGIQLTGSCDRIEIDGMDCLARGAASASQRMVFIQAGCTRTHLKGMTMSATELEDGAYNVANGTIYTNINGLIGATIVRAVDFWMAEYLEGIEVSDPAAPSTNYGRLYFRDNGAGKTQLVVRFATGAVQVIATQP